MRKTLALIFLIVFSGICARPMHWTFMNMIKDKPLKEQFKLWHYVMNKHYDLNTETGLYRYKIFKKNYEYIEKRNAQNLSFKLGLGPFADLTLEEFKKTYLTLRKPTKKTQSTQRFLSLFDDMVDYEEKQLQVINSLAKKPINRSKINPKTGYPFLKDQTHDWTSLWPEVQNQGSCGSCWAFATSAILEAASVQSGKPFSFLSPQQFVDCDSDDSGCNGGWYSSALSYASLNGIEQSKDYPYSGVQGNCSIDASTPKIKVSDSNQCEENCDTGSALETGPFATAIFASSNDFQNYYTGVLNYDCSGELDHAVVVVYADDDVLKVRNSWGNDWGEEGYFRFLRNQANNKTCYLEAFNFQVTGVSDTFK